jgi:hypothetical protein
MRHERFRHKPLLFASREEAVVYLELMGFTVEESHIGCNGLAMATQRTLFAMDWLCDNGFSYAAPSLEDAARHQTSPSLPAKNRDFPAIIRELG